MIGDSTSPGILAPTSIDHPQNDGDLDAIIQTWVSGITGIPGSLCRPRWQPTPPPQPPQDVNWVSLGCLQQVFDDWHYVEQVDDDHAVMTRHETMEYLLTFYGPNASGLSIRLRDGAMVTQNRDMLTANGINVFEFGGANNTPLLANEVFRGRCDLPLHFRRQINTLFPIKSLRSAPFSLWDEARVRPPPVPAVPGLLTWTGAALLWNGQPLTWTPPVAAELNWSGQAVVWNAQTLTWTPAL